MIAYLSLSLNFFAKQTIVSDFLSSTVHNFKHRNQFKVLSRYYRLCVNELILLHHFLLFSSFFSFYGITLDDLFFSYSYYLFIMVWTLFLIIGITLTVFGLIFLEPILIFFGASADVLPYAYDYMKIILYGSIFLAIGTGMNNFIRAEGNPKVAMNTMIVGTVTNIILDYIFIFIFNWGIKGAAFATIISYMITSYLVIRYFIRGNSRLKIRRENLMLRKLIVKSVLIIGFPTFVLQVTGSIQQLILNKSLVHYGGDKALAIIGIIMSIVTFLVMPAMGISQGAQPIIGFNYGSEQYERVKETLKLAILSATAIVFLGFVISKIWPYQLFGLFSKDAELIELGVHGMGIFFMFLPLVGIQMISASYFQAVGKPNQATLLSLSRQVIIFIPMLILLPRFWGLEGVWWSAPFSDLGAFFLTGIWLFIEIRSLSKSQSLSMEDPEIV